MKRSLMAIGLTLLVAGCVPSLNPLFTEKDLVSDPALPGVWVESDSTATWNFSKTGENKYKLVQANSGGRKAEFDVRLVKLNDRRFLDLYVSKLSDPEIELNEWASASLVPAHLILQVYGIGKTLKIAAMNPDWIKEHLEQHPDALEHRMIEKDRVLITASTKDLQKYILLHAEGEGLFGEPAELKRKD
jgi:hypothetical protein